MACRFNLSHYREILKIARRHHRIGPFALQRQPLDGKGARLILRHDVDSSLEAAVEMAKVEKNLGVSATYFLQLHSDFYSSTSHSGVSAVRQLLKWGHEVGLHFDPAFYRKMKWTQNKGLRTDLAVLSELTGKKIVSVSRHLPLVNRERLSLPDSVKYDAYDSRFISGRYKYISDSNSIFREDCFCKHLEAGVDFYFLVHPVWWVNPGKHWREKLARQVENDKRRMDLRLKEKISGYNKQLKSRKVRDRQFIRALAKGQS